MIILGNKYKFTELETARLANNFDSIVKIEYDNTDYTGVIQRLEEIIDAHNATIVLLNTKATVSDDIIKFLTKIQFKNQRKTLRFISIEHFLEEYLQKCYIPDDYTDLDFLENIKPFNLFEYALKRAIDYASIFVLLFITWPVLIYARFKIKKESPGVAMFKQLRVGKNNQEFTCVKFRSMYLDAEANGAQFASQNDHRVFQWGEFMRKTRIDELPQMLNVLRGDMHLIGPRPERKVWTDEFELQIPYYSERHLVKPGITGWAQVMYPYGANAEDARQKLMYDLYYIKHWSLWLELKTIFKTIQVVLGKEGV